MSHADSHVKHLARADRARAMAAKKEAKRERKRLEKLAANEARKMEKNSGIRRMNLAPVALSFEK
jgi:hypothetical protein